MSSSSSSVSPAAVRLASCCGCGCCFFLLNVGDRDARTLALLGAGFVFFRDLCFGRGLVMPVNEKDFNTDRGFDETEWWVAEEP